MSIDKLGFLGAGQMATALAAGGTAAGLLGPDSLWFCDPSADQLSRVRDRFAGCRVTAEARELFGECELVVLAVKPQVLVKVAAELRPLVTPRHVLVSIAAGVPLQKLREWFGTDAVVRVMPNTPAQVGVGAAGIATSMPHDSPRLRQVVQVMESVGAVAMVDDSMMDAVTGLSGSGPAFVLTFIEAMIDAAVAAGLSRQVGTTLSVQTVLGTAKMVQETGLHPAALKDQVTSPAGTTIAGLRALEAAGMRSAVIEAVIRAVERSVELRG